MKHTALSMQWDKYTGITLEIYVNGPKAHEHMLEGAPRPGILKTFRSSLDDLPRTHFLVILQAKCMKFTNVLWHKDS